MNTIDELIYIGATDIDNMAAVLELHWVRDTISKAERDAIHWLRVLNYRETKVAALVVPMPFLATVSTNDVLAIHAMSNLAAHGLLPALDSHPVFKDGITDDETTLIAATGTLRQREDIRRLLAPGYATIETSVNGTPMTPYLRISIVRTGSRSKPGTTDAINDAVEFVERSMRLPLPVDHVIVVFDEKAVTDSYAGTNYGFAFSYLPKYEQLQGAFEWRRLHAGLVHEIAHYYWRGNKNWIDEGMADIIEYLYGVESELSLGQLTNRRGNCEAHNIAMLSEWAPSSSSQHYRCNYFLGRMLFQSLMDSMGVEAFSTKMGEFYRLSLAERGAGAPGLGVVQQVFSAQLDIISLHWSGEVNAPGNRPLDEGIARVNHDLIEWDQYPTYNGRSVSFRGTLLGDAILSQATILQTKIGAGYPNFLLRPAAGREHVGFILPPEEDGWTWRLNDPGDTVATVYQLGDRQFNIEFLVPKGLGNPTDYVVTVRGFQDNSRTPTIGERTDVIGYARIRGKTP